MRTHSCSALLCLATVLALAAAGASAADGQSVEASCLVKIYFEPSPFAADMGEAANVLGHLVRTTPVKLRAAAEVKRKLKLDGLPEFEIGLQCLSASAARGRTARAVRSGAPGIALAPMRTLPFGSTAKSVRVRTPVRPGAPGKRKIRAGFTRGLGQPPDRPPEITRSSGMAPAWWMSPRSGPARGLGGARSPKAGGLRPESSLTAKLELSLASATQETANALLLAVCQRLEEVLGGWSDKEVARLQDRLARAEKESERAKNQLDVLRKGWFEMQKLFGDSSLSPDEAAGAVKRLGSEARELRLQLTGDRARRRALEERIATAKKEAEVKLERDPVIAELRGIVALRKEQFAVEKKGYEVLLERNAVSEIEVKRTVLGLQEKIAEAKVALAQRREELVNAAGGSTVKEITGEVEKLAVADAEMSARLERLGEERQGLLHDEVERQQRLQAAPRAQDIQSQLRVAQQSYEDILWLREDMRRRMAMAKQVRVIVVGEVGQQ